MAIRFKAVEQKHYDRSMALSGKDRERYIMGLVDWWEDRQAQPDDYDKGLIPSAKVKEVVSQFRAMFEAEKKGKGEE